MAPVDGATRATVRATIVASLIGATVALAGTWVGARQAAGAAREARRVAVEDRRAEAYNGFIVAARRVELDIASLLRQHYREDAAAKARYGKRYHQHIDGPARYEELGALAHAAERMCGDQAPVFLAGSPQAVDAAIQVCRWATGVPGGKIGPSEIHGYLSCALNDFVAAARRDLGSPNGATDLWYREGLECEPDRVERGPTFTIN